jgi:hypothetical protein
VQHDSLYGDPHVIFNVHWCMSRSLWRKIAAITGKHMSGSIRDVCVGNVAQLSDLDAFDALN